MNFAVPLSFITQVRPDDVGQPEGIHIPRAPGRTFRTAWQDGFQPVAVPLLAKLWCVLFPINALCIYGAYFSRVCGWCQVCDMGS